MSLTIALKAFDGLVLAADSRMTEGYTLSGPKTRDDSVKFIQLKDNLGLLTYGLSDIGYAGITSLGEEISKDFNQRIQPESILDRSTWIFKKADSEWGRNNPQVSRRDNDVGFILGGYDGERGEFVIFNFQSPDFLPKKIKSGCLLAGQWHVAKYFVEKLYKSEMSIELLSNLSVFLLDATTTVEKTVGGTISLATITKSGFKWATIDEIDSIKERNSLFLEFFRERFYSALLSVVNSNRERVFNGRG